VGLFPAVFPRVFLPLFPAVFLPLFPGLGNSGNTLSAGWAPPAVPPMAKK
jgi:hypothetical protein